MSGSRGFVGVLAISSAIVSAVAHGDVYRWTDERGRVHYSNLRENIPAGVQAERLPDAPLPSAPAVRAPTETGVSNSPAVAPASLDIERFELQRRHREARDRLASIDAQLKTSAASIEGALEAGEGAVTEFEQRKAKELHLQRERSDVMKQIDEMRARYADLSQRAAQANGGQLPVEWDPELP
jgi:hypothetical protein